MEASFVSVFLVTQVLIFFYLPIFSPGEYAVRFIPRENGPHLVYVSFDGCQIRDSPFRIQVGTVHADPGMVQAYGDGLKTGKTGRMCF